MRSVVFAAFVVLFCGHSLTEAAELPEITNSIGVKMNLIPAGKFTMGEGNDSHQVTLTKPFYLGVTEVTNAQWQAVMGSVPSKWTDPDHPVEQVSWEDVVAFCQKLSAMPDERTAGREYRIPTESEWEYACRAGSTTQWSFGDDLLQGEEFCQFYGNANGHTHPVGQKQPNGWGLYDMHGNVWEWCSDWYGEYAGGSLKDPRGPSRGSYRVNRGGSWGSTHRGYRSALRNGSFPSNRLINLGFRLALSPSGAKPPEAGK